MTIEVKQQEGGNLLKLLHPAIRAYFIDDLKHSELTLVQQCTIKNMLANFDCILQAPTGSGKSLAYILPTLHIVNEKRQTTTAKSSESTAGSANASQCQILALVVAPSRELVNQLHCLVKPICKTLKLNAIRLYGAGGAHKKRIKIGIQHFKGQCILIATPGRVESFLEKEPDLKQFLKHLEVLIIDEADRYSDQESRRSLTTLLSILPKQRRTGLFSATQATALEDLLKFGLRNPLRLSVGGAGKMEEIRQEKAVVEQLEQKEEEDGSATEVVTTRRRVTPKELENFYACVPAECKLLALLKFLKSQKRSKVLVFVSNAAQSEYFAQILPPLLEDPQRVVLSLHRKMENKRQKILDKFRATDRAILFATDVLARGVDVVDIDWVLQFDIPKLSTLFVHRSGRSGRMGRQGRSLLLLTEEESAYVDFIRSHERVELAESEFAGMTEERAEKLRGRIQQMAIEDRKILELGSSAFVSLVEAYSRHDCQIVCKVKDLNLPGLANAFGLLRLPKIREMAGRGDLAEFRPRMDIQTGQIQFKEAKLEEKRQRKKLALKSGGAAWRQVEVKVEAVQEEEETTVQRKGKKKRKMSDWEQLQKGGQLLKKFKRGKMSREELDAELDEF